MTAAGTCERDVTSNSSASHHVRLCSRFGLRPEALAQMGCMPARDCLLDVRAGQRLLGLYASRTRLPEPPTSLRHCSTQRVPEAKLLLTHR